jgi:hypothetical protein
MDNKSSFIHIDNNPEPSEGTIEAFKEKMYAVRSISHTIRALINVIGSSGALNSISSNISNCNFSNLNNEPRKGDDTSGGQHSNKSGSRKTKKDV